MSPFYDAKWADDLALPSSQRVALRVNASQARRTAARSALVLASILATVELHDLGERSLEAGKHAGTSQVLAAMASAQAEGRLPGLTHLGKPALKVITGLEDLGTAVVTAPRAASRAVADVLHETVHPHATAEVPAHEAADRRAVRSRSR